MVGLVLKKKKNILLCYKFEYFINILTICNNDNKLKINVFFLLYKTNVFNIRKHLNFF